VEVYNDIDHALYDFFTTLSDPDEFEALYRRVAPLPYCRQLYDECRRTWADQADKRERVWRWFVVARQSFSGHFGTGWGAAIRRSHRAMAEEVSHWLACLDALPEVHSRLARVQIDCKDWRDVLDTYDTPDTLFYLDPPYVPKTRRQGAYAHEMTGEDHEELVSRLLSIEGLAVLSGYPNEVYKPLEDAGWTVRTRQTACHAAGRTRTSGIQGNGTALALQPRTECLWIKPGCGTRPLPGLW